VRTLTPRELNRATLARQLLLERRRLSPAAVIERLAGMQAQWAPAPYVGIWSRVDGFRRESLERLVRRGDVLKPTLMRGTLHLVTARDYPFFFAALRDFRWWSSPEATPIGVAAAPAIRQLYAREPLPASAALEHLAEAHGVEDETIRRRSWFVARVAGHVLHAPETALWKLAPRTRFAAVPEPETIDATAARAELVRRYLAAFGPATRADISAWSGMPVRDFAAALETLEPLRRFRDEQGRELLDVPRAPLPPADTPAPVRFLPKFDNLLLSFADRTRVVTDEVRRSVINGGDVLQTFLVDGMVAGTWSVERGRVVLEPLRPVPRSARRALADEGARLAAFVG
jgi:Winged helix DNA-binding domain